MHPARLLLALLPLSAVIAAPVQELQQRDLFDNLGALGDLLQGDSLREVQSIINHASLLFDDQTTNETKALIGTASTLLTASNVQQLEGLLQGAGGLLGGVGGLLNNQTVMVLNSLLTNANALLTPDFVKDTTTLITDITLALPSIAKLLGGLAGQPSS